MENLISEKFNSNRPCHVLIDGNYLAHKLNPNASEHYLYKAVSSRGKTPVVYEQDIKSSFTSLKSAELQPTKNSNIPINTLMGIDYTSLYSTMAEYSSNIITSNPFTPMSALYDAFPNITHLYTKFYKYLLSYFPLDKGGMPNQQFFAEVNKFRVEYIANYVIFYNTDCSRRFVTTNTPIKIKAYLTADLHYPLHYDSLVYQSPLTFGGFSDLISFFSRDLVGLRRSSITQGQLNMQVISAYHFIDTLNRYNNTNQSDGSRYIPVQIMRSINRGIFMFLIGECLCAMIDGFHSAHIPGPHEWDYLMLYRKLLSNISNALSNHTYSEYLNNLRGVLCVLGYRLGSQVKIKN